MASLLVGDGLVLVLRPAGALIASIGLTTKRNTAAAIATNVITDGDEGAVAEDGVVDREREVAEVGLPMIIATIGMIRSLTSEFTTAANATPITNATARLDDVALHQEVWNSLQHGASSGRWVSLQS